MMYVVQLMYLEVSIVGKKEVTCCFSRAIGQNKPLQDPALMISSCTATEEKKLPPLTPTPFIMLMVAPRELKTKDFFNRC